MNHRRPIGETTMIVGVIGSGAIGPDLATIDELVPVVYDDVPVSLHGWARHSLLAHAIKLVEEGRATVSGDYYTWGS